MGGGMMSGGTDWLAPVLVLGIGLAAGFFLAMSFARGKRAARAASAALASGKRHDDVALRDLRVERDGLIAQLRELDDLAGKRTPEQLAQQRWELELAAAKVLRDLDAAEKAAREVEVAAAPVAAPAGRLNPQLVGALWGGGVVLFGAILFFVLQSATSDRMAGGSVTGNTGMMAGGPMQGAPMQGGMPAPEEAQPDPEVDQLKEFAEKNPTSLDAKLDLAQALIYRDRLVEAFQVVQAANQIQAGHPRALTYEAIVRQAMGQGDRALQMLDQAVEKDPKLAEAWVRRGLAAFEQAKFQVAIDSWQKALELRPDGKDALEPVIQEAKDRLAGKTPQEIAAAAGADDAPAMGGGMAAPAMGGGMAAPAGGAAAGAADGAGLNLVVTLDPALQGKVAAGIPLFVAVRPAGVTRGPPAAVKRLVTGTFPMQIAMGAGDTMMGQPFPADAYVEVRIDSDGNAMTKDPSDPVASQDGVKSGATPVSLVLKAQ